MCSLLDTAESLLDTAGSTCCLSSLDMLNFASVWHHGLGMTFFLLRWGIGLKPRTMLIFWLLSKNLVYTSYIFSKD